MQLLGTRLFARWGVRYMNGFCVARNHYHYRYLWMYIAFVQNYLKSVATSPDAMLTT
jgi:hypothetical protein